MRLPPGPIRGAGRQPQLDAELVAQVEELVHTGPAPESQRATWTLQDLADSLTELVGEVTQLSRETVRRFLIDQKIKYRKAKKWLSSPDPQYRLRKRQRDRLLKMARGAEDGAAVWLDESWFVKWPYPYWDWSRPDEPPIVRQRWDEEVDKVALFASLDDESQESFLQWAEGQPNSDKMITFFEAFARHWSAKGKRFIVLFWDKASWHTSQKTRNWLRAYNHQAKQNGNCRILVCYHPTRSPWLMPLEAVFGAVKHRILGKLEFETLAALKAVVEHYFRQRVPAAKVRRDKAWEKFLALATA